MNHECHTESVKRRSISEIRMISSDQRIVLVIDALNQLTGGHDLAWLPTRLGDGVRLIVSCIADPRSPLDSPEARVLTALEKRKPTPDRLSLAPLSEGEILILSLMRHIPLLAGVNYAARRRDKKR